MKREIMFPEYLPDQSVNSGVSRRARNVYAAADGYRPVGAFSAISDPLDEPFLGGKSVKSTNGTAYLLAGTATDLYRFAAGAWNSLVTGLSIVDRWEFVQFGNFVIAVNGQVTRDIDLNAGTDAALAGAPTGTSIAVVGDFVVIGQADGNELLVQWSGFNDRTQWTAGTNQSGFQPMLTGGEVMGLAGGEYGLIFQRNAIKRMNLTGDPAAPFQFDEISSNFGCAAKASIATEGRTTFFLSDRGFMAIEDGQQVTAIGSEKVDRTFQRSIGPDDYERMYSAIDPINKLVMWGVPGNPGTIWCYNWELQRWAIIEVNFTGLFSGFTSSQTLEEVSAIYPDIDAMPYSLDDDRFAGGDPKLYIVNGANEVGTLSGENLEAEIGFGFTQFTKGFVARMRHLRPITDATDGVSVTLDCRARLGDNEVLTTTTDLRASGVMPIRCAGRYISPVMCHEAGSTWRYSQGLEFEFSRGGER